MNSSQSPSVCVVEGPALDRLFWPRRGQVATMLCGLCCGRLLVVRSLQGNGHLQVAVFRGLGKTSRVGMVGAEAVRRFSRWARLRLSDLRLVEVSSGEVGDGQ